MRLRTFLTAGMVFGCSVSLQAIGLSSPVVEVRVDQVKPGRTIHIVPPDSAGGLLLENTGDEPLEIDVKVLVPSADQLRGKALPIPDPSWIRITPERLMLPAGERRVCFMDLKVPRDRRWRGQFFQAMIWSRGTSTQGGGVRMSAGLLSRVMIRTLP
jgi:hypothetical protein